MKTEHGHLSYCTNIHQGDDWTTHFEALKANFPTIKANVAPNDPMGIGLRLSHRASLELSETGKLAEFQDWLKQEEAYVFTMNGFPYGEFHHGVVKDGVHRPDWTTPERLNYTIRLFELLEALLPDGMDGGVSTLPLSYRHWYTDEAALTQAINSATQNILKIVEQVIRIEKNSAKVLHLDIEPEPDGILETGREFIDWYENFLIPLGIAYLSKQLAYTPTEAEEAIKRHVHLCYDVCHFALGYEDHTAVIQELQEKGIKVGKIQISAALKATIPANETRRKEVIDAFNTYNEPTYLHQVIAQKDDGEIIRYRDLPEAFAHAMNPQVTEWRAHFHVPIFLEDFDPLESTQSDIISVLQLQQAASFTQHLEVETYTWEVLPTPLKRPLAESIQRELLWVKEQLS